MTLRSGCATLFRVPLRFLALVVLLAVLPTAEVGEQLVHFAEHALEGEAPDHPAHHDETSGDEHGCTGLMHLCACHHTQVTAATALQLSSSVETFRALQVYPPQSLVDQSMLEPPHRPPIG